MYRAGQCDGNTGQHDAIGTWQQLNRNHTLKLSVPEVFDLVFDPGAPKKDPLAVFTALVNVMGTPDSTMRLGRGINYIGITP